MRVGLFLAIVATLFYVGHLRNRRTPHPSGARRWPRLFNLRVHIDPTAQIFPASLRTIPPAPGTRPFALHVARPGDVFMRPPRYDYPPSYETVVSDHREIAYPGAVYMSPDYAGVGARRTATQTSGIDSTIP